MGGAALGLAAVTDSTVTLTKATNVPVRARKYKYVQACIWWMYRTWLKLMTKAQEPFCRNPEGRTATNSMGAFPLHPLSSASDDRVVIRMANA